MELNEKLEPLFLLIAIVLGLLAQDINILKNNSSHLITIFLFLMLYGLFLEVPINELKKSFKNFKFTKISLIINFIWTPLLGYFLGSIFLNQNIDILIGFFLLILTPCTDWYLLFTKMAKGDLNLSLSILPTNLILQVILLPIYLIIFFSANNNLDYIELGYSLLTMIVLPFGLAQVTKFLIKDSDEIASKFSDLQSIFLAIAVFGIFNSEGELLLNNLNSILTIFIPLIIFFCVNVILDFFVAHKVNFSYEEYASLTMTTLARNSPLALAITVNSFPGRELIAIALVIGPLIELPVLYIVSKLLLKIRNSYS